MATPIRFVHLSDFHIGKDDWAQQRLLDRILEHLKDQCTRGFVPDLIFVTGDVANRGKKTEYDAFRREFFSPLLEQLGKPSWNGRLFAVPGNHDVIRPEQDVLNRVAAIAPGSRFFDPTPEGKTAREQVIPRFKQYKKVMPAHVSADWIASPRAAFAEKADVGGQSIGVVGINTAWLSMDDEDQGKLTPGVALVETALASVASCDLRIVLGHHPLSWLSEDEARRLRALFGHHKVIYLHGHLHRTEGRRDEGAGEAFLSFQAGAAFQARDDEPWKNGLVLGEIDNSRRELRLSPRYWNADNYDWPTETGRFPEKLRIPGSDWWAWSLPGSQPERRDSTPERELVRGWDLLDASGLDARRREITADEAARFFDGGEPDWSHALSKELPRRTVVDVLAERVAGYRDRERPQVTLLIGPGGEGKSMALRQAVASILGLVPAARVVWRRDDTSGFAEGDLLALPKNGAPWIVATDSADLVAKSLHEAVQKLQRAGRGDVQFLLAARESDWRAIGASRLDWRSHSEYFEYVLSGLSLEDARKISRSWLTFGETRGVPNAAENGEALAEQLHRACLAEAASGEGALLGGALAVRLGGDGLRGHVKSLLQRLGDAQISGGRTLYDAFAYLAVMHAQGLDFLSRPVLAQALNCEAASLHREVLFPLGREAAGGGGTLLLTRHRRIAQAAVEIMRDEYGDDTEQRYIELALAAVMARRAAWIPELRSWEYGLAEHFFANDPGLAIRIAEALLKNDPVNARRAVHVARLYRESGDPGAGADLLRAFASTRGQDRAFWREWSACAGTDGDPYVSAWLAGWSVADRTDVPTLENDQAKQSLAGLGLSFRELYARQRDPVFVEAEGAVGQLGLMLDLDPKTRSYLEDNARDAQVAGIPETTVSGYIERLQRGLTSAWTQCAGSQDLAEKLPEPAVMTFSCLERLVGRSA